MRHSLALCAGALLFLSGNSLAQTTHQVELIGNTFVPADLSICEGDTVEWVWVQGFHNVESGKNGSHDGIFLSGPPALAPQPSFSVTFDTAFLTANPVANDAYDYFCVVHQTLGMEGTIRIANTGSATQRNGGGINPKLLTNLTVPQLGMTWDIQLDCSAHASGGLGVLSGYALPSSGPVLKAGELLVDPTSAKMFRFVQGHGGGVTLFSKGIPNDPNLCALNFSTQGFCTGSPGPQLSNAYDLVVGP